MFFGIPTFLDCFNIKTHSGFCEELTKINILFSIPTQSGHLKKKNYSFRQ